ncbi:ADC synthase [Microstroma glucosiphilum]|uniref:aminodeoxychorismate synthase n=1 Tax=Pseudomicrostroma glucosiphilum TaxID=1684307 RepID=A0A316UCW5_9BASI|nr:ADC synthase [Pseudomicrostroma glucosiphilum]PWN23002.1 ADC synthase [Pseudomicrostroma glucosiphilum]
MMAGATSNGSASSLPRILIVDHFDSYTLNILSLLSAIAGGSDEELSHRVVVLPHTHRLLASQDMFQQKLLPHFDAVILSPGPGSPDRRADFGFGFEFLQRAELYGIPTLGVCLGHQGISVAFGGSVKRAKSIQHGTASQLRFPGGEKTGNGLFEGVMAGTMVTRYNSLTIESEDLPDCLEVTAYADDLPNTVTTPSPSSDLMRSRATSPHMVTSERSIMGVAHKTLPLWGVQFHPESIESQAGVVILSNFLRFTQNCVASSFSSTPTPTFASSSSFGIPASIVAEGQRYVAAASGSEVNGPEMSVKPPLQILEHLFEIEASPARSPEPEEAIFHNLFRSGSSGSIWLDSARRGDPQAKNSYMSRPSFTLSYQRSTSEVMLAEQISSANPARVETEGHTSFWSYMNALQKELHHAVRVKDIDEASRSNLFRIGFVGNWGFEMKDESLGLDEDETISASPCDSNGRDAASVFGFCEAVLRYDHLHGRWCASVLVRRTECQKETLTSSPLLQELRRVRGKEIGLTAEEAHAWIERVQKTLSAAARGMMPVISAKGHALPRLRPLDSPNDYKAKVEAARALIAQGESYELCLTTQFVGQLSTGEPSDPFAIYRALRAKNPAPYSAFIDLRTGAAGDKVILSTSPERFLSMTAQGQVEMKPIKGTLPRAGFGRGEANLLASKGPRWAEQEDALRRTRLEADPKERAENLMIVDLIRADLMSFCLPSSVRVPTLMQVESYESVHQLVTTVQGVAKKNIGPVEALRRCFPPGSMTGAPKRRSVTLLERLEGKSRAAEGQEWKLQHRPRGVYSGALGWIGVDGAADFSVVIRTAVVEQDGTISIGAGGAITYLSDADKEWEEVLQKVSALAEVDLS